MLYAEYIFITYTPDLILLEVNLPGRDGMAVCSDIRKKQYLHHICDPPGNGVLAMIFGEYLSDHLGKILPQSAVAELRFISVENEGTCIQLTFPARNSQ